MPMYALCAVWSNFGENVTHKEIGKPFEATGPEQALEDLQIQYSFLSGLPWHFAGKDYKLLGEVTVGEEFKMQDASNYGD